MENHSVLLDSLIGEPVKLAYDQVIIDRAPQGIENTVIPAPAAPDTAAAVAALADQAIHNTY